MLFRSGYWNGGFVDTVFQHRLRIENSQPHRAQDMTDGCDENVSKMWILMVVAGIINVHGECRPGGDAVMFADQGQFALRPPDIYD